MQVVTNSSVVLNKAKIKQATEASETATVTMIALGLRERAHIHTNLLAVKNQLLKMNEKVIEKDYMNFWKALEDAGAGSLILGRRGGRTRFEWNYSLRQIAQHAIEGKETEIKRFETKLKDMSNQPAKPLETDSRTAKEVLHEKALKLSIDIPQMEVLAINLRPNCVVQVIVPKDITGQELSQVTEALMNSRKEVHIA